MLNITYLTTAGFHKQIFIFLNNMQTFIYNPFCHGYKRHFNYEYIFSFNSNIIYIHNLERYINVFNKKYHVKNIMEIKDLIYSPSEVFLLVPRILHWASKLNSK